MNDNNNDKHYATLGLRHGATQEEIHAAFQRMEELYPPALRDASLDARVRFLESRKAYHALRNSGSLDTLEAKVLEDIAEFDRKMDDRSSIPKISLRDYFFRLKLVIAVVGSIIAVYVAVKYLTLIPLTDESSARLLKHTAIFIFVFWLFFWYMRLTESHGQLVFLSGAVYALWIHFVTLPQIVPPTVFQYPRLVALLSFFMCFVPILTFATHFSEGGLTELKEKFEQIT